MINTKFRIVVPLKEKGVERMNSQGLPSCRMSKRVVYFSLTHTQCKCVSGCGYTYTYLFLCMPRIKKNSHVTLSPGPTFLSASSPVFWPSVGPWAWTHLRWSTCFFCLPAPIKQKTQHDNLRSLQGLTCIYPGYHWWEGKTQQGCAEGGANLAAREPARSAHF